MGHAHAHTLCAPDMHIHIRYVHICHAIRFYLFVEVVLGTMVVSSHRTEMMCMNCTSGAEK